MLRSLLVLMEHISDLQNKVELVVAAMVWGDFDFYVPSSCPAPQPILPNFQLPKQNEAVNGTPKINVNPTQVHDHLPNPVLM